MRYFPKRASIKTTQEVSCLPSIPAESVTRKTWTKKNWNRLQRWCQHRPLWGALCTLIASLLILCAPLCILQYGLVPANTLWGGLLVGGLLFAMGLVQLLAPSQRIVAGAAGIILAIISLITALGGFGIGMLLGIIGCSSALAWRPEKKVRNSLVFWSALSCAMIVTGGLIAMISQGEIAIAAPLIGRFHSFTRRLECHNIRITDAISQADHRTPVIRVHADYCLASYLVVTRHALGATVTITQATTRPAILRNTVTEIVETHVGQEDSQQQVVVKSEQTEAVSIQTNVSSVVVFESTESATIPDISVSIS